MGYLGYRLRVPSKRQEEAWRELAQAIIGPSGSLARAKDHERARLIRRLEEEIARLEAAPKGKTRAMKIRSYQKQLAKLREWSIEAAE